MKAVIFTDGGSRGNPGKAAIGYVIKAEDGSTVYECGMNIGTATNNAAEYTAVLEALKAALGMVTTVWSFILTASWLKSR